jgi:CRISP-associated protein Cas1
MDKMSVVLDRRDLDISLEGKALRIDCKGSFFQRIPLGMVEQVIVYGNPKVDCSVWRTLSAMCIPAVLLPARGSGNSTWISAGLSTSIMVRLNQYNAWCNMGLKRKSVEWLIKRKLKSILSLMDVMDISNKVYEKTRNSLNKSLVALSSGKNIDTLRGVEGAAAKEWFAFLGAILHKKWQFKGRNRRPPRDPVNALLSLTYTLLFSEIRKEVHSRGVDPCLGFLHTPYPGRESLVLDLAEPLRAGADAMVLTLIKQSMNPEHFTYSRTEGCRITKEGRGLYYYFWEDWKKNWPCTHCSIEDVSDGQTLRYTSRKLLESFARLWDVPDKRWTGQMKNSM